MPPRRDLAVMACHFNPCGYRSRQRNLLAFVAYMRSRGFPVSIAELAFNGERVDAEKAIHGR